MLVESLLTSHQQSKSCHRLCWRPLLSQTNHWKASCLSIYAPACLHVLHVLCSVLIAYAWSLSLVLADVLLKLLMI